MSCRWQVIGSRAYRTGSHIEVACDDARITIQCEPDANGICNLSVIGGTARRLGQGSEFEYISKQDFDSLIKEAVLDKTYLDAFLMELML
jgi:hypothetical protein